MKDFVIYLACFFNRNLRYGDSKNRFAQFLVIRTRVLLKKFIQKNIESINQFGLKRINLAHAGKMQLQTNDYIDRWLYTGADFEPHVVDLFLKMLKKGDTVLDIGANIGYFSLIASKLVGKRGKIYAFEPSPPTIKKLEKNFGLNNIHNIILIKKAVSESTGNAIFKMPSDNIKNSGRSSLRDIEEHNIEVQVETITLDSMLNKFETVHLIKMDIEGAEAMALKGMRKLIDRDQPIFIMELTDLYLKQLGSSAEYVLDFFWGLNYKIFITGGPIQELKHYIPLEQFQCDILCIPSEKFIKYKDILN